jgi:hypothetical protein
MAEEKVYDDYKECVICFENLGKRNIMTFPCGHKCAHVTCFVKSIDATHSAVCPVCRWNLIEREEHLEDITNSLPTLRRSRRFPSVILDLLNRFYDIPHLGGIIIEGSVIDEQQSPEPLPRPRRQRSIQCQGIKVDGNRCKRKTKEENGYCYTHQDQYIQEIV